MARANTNDFKMCIKYMNEAKKYMDSAEDILYIIPEHVDSSILMKDNGGLTNILRRLYTQQEKCNRIINYCNTVVESYETMELNIQNKLNNLITISARLTQSAIKSMNENIQDSLKANSNTVKPKTSTKNKNIFQKSLSGIKSVGKGVQKTTSSAVKNTSNFMNSISKKVGCNCGNWALGLGNKFTSATKDAISITSGIGKSKAVKSACDFGKWMLYEPASEKWKDIKNIGKENWKDIKSTACNFGEWMLYEPVDEKWKDIKNIGERTMATICNASSSFTWGLLDFVEGSWDSLNIIGTAILTNPALLYDVNNYIYSKIAGKKFESKTVEMWKNTKAEVADDWVGYYKQEQEESEYGQWLKEESYAYTGTKQASESIGTISGAIILSVLTGGLGSMASGTAVSPELAGGIFMGASSLGSGSEQAWNNGATLGEGLAYGGASAIIDGFSYYLGAKLGKVVLGSGTSAGSKLGTAAFRIGTDSADGFVSSLIQTPLQKIYRDESLKTIFKENGGWKSVAINTFIAGGLSTLSTIHDIKGDNLVNSKNLNTNNVENIDANNVKKPTVTLQEQIDMANFEVQKGHFTSIDINSIDDIDYSDLAKLTNPENVIFRLSDGTTYDYKDILDMKYRKFSLDNNIQVVNARTLNNPMEVAQYFNDSKQYLYQKLKALATNNHDNIEINNFYKKIGDTKISKIDEKELYEFMKSHLSYEEKKVYKTLSKNTYLKIYTTEEKKVIDTFTKFGGPMLEAKLRNTKTIFDNRVIDGTDDKKVNSYLKKCWEATHFEEAPSDNMVEYFVKQLDNIIEKTPVLSETLIVKRGAGNLYYNGEQIDLTTAKPGTMINDSAYTSVSAIDTRISNRNNIQLEITLPKGTKASYIEPFTGIKNYGQQELILPRNSKYVITSYPQYNPNTNTTIVKAELLLE